MRIAYYRVCPGDLDIGAQRAALGGGFDREFEDVAVASGTMATRRPGLAKLFDQVRPGDTVSVLALDRLGRDALDVEATLRRLIEAGVTVNVHGLRPIGRGVGAAVMAVLAQVADMERQRIKARTEAGRAVARATLKATGKTHRGKSSLGRPKAQDAAAVAAWRCEAGASIQQTATHFSITAATVKRYCAAQRAIPAPPPPPSPIPTSPQAKTAAPKPPTPPPRRPAAISSRPVAASLARFREAHLGEAVDREP